jgi:hypothetical protein
MIFVSCERPILTSKIIEHLTIYKKVTEFRACFAIFDRKTFILVNVLKDADREKNSASNEITPVPHKCHFQSGLSKNLVFQAETK